MKNKRRIHSAEFKARVALEAIKSIKTVQEIAADNQVHPTQVTQWKSQMLAGASEVFDQGRGRKMEQ
jgi:putative transposase